MSDYNSSLPIRTEGAGDVISKIADATIPSQQLKVNANGSIDVESSDLDIRDLVFATDKVDVSGSEVSLDATTLAALENVIVSATDLDIRDLVFATDKVDVTGSDITATVTATDLDIRDLVFATDKVDVSGSEVSLDAGTLAALESITVQNGAGGSAVNIQDGGNSITVDAVDLDIRDLAAASDSVTAWLKDEAGNAFSEANPLWVIQSEKAGVEIHDYNVASAIAGGATSNHDLTSGAEFACKKVIGSASGKAKFELQFETAAASGVFVTKGVQFNSTANSNIEFELAPAFIVPSGAKVRVIRTNKDNQAQDLYSTIMGLE